MKAIDVHGHFGVYDRGSGGMQDRCYSGEIEVVSGGVAALTSA